jgi:hypothetical protein
VRYDGSRRLLCQHYNLYAVFLAPDRPSCTYPDYETRGEKCKHIFAVEYVVQREENPDGTTTVTETVSVTETVRKTYPQDWTNYNKAQMNEKVHFQALLHDLCKTIPEPPQPMGRPRISLADMVFSTAWIITNVEKEDARLRWVITNAESRTDPLQEAEAALKALREASDQYSRSRAADQLEKASKKVREQQKKPVAPPAAK